MIYILGCLIPVVCFAAWAGVNRDQFIRLPSYYDVLNGIPRDARRREAISICSARDCVNVSMASVYCGRSSLLVRE